MKVFRMRVSIYNHISFISNCCTVNIFLTKSTTLYICSFNIFNSTSKYF
ncbi:MAG: hypothetical protein Q8S84_09175 [bacterium]|nr:hypothetical protein [bacterium]